jgi:undecaprenyl-diphosphatase
MPSNHAANMFAFATTLSFFYKRYKTFLFILASLIAFSRVYVGVHFPGDIFFGALIGYIISWFLLTTWNNIRIKELIKGKSWVWYETPNLKFKKLVR